MHSSRLAVLSLGLSLTFIPACNENQRFDSGVPENKRLDELDSDEEAQLCEAMQESLTEFDDREDLHLLNCALAAEAVSPLVEGDVVAACQAVYDDCLASEPDSESLSASECEVEACEATVGQLEDCTSDQLAMLDAMFDRARDFRCEDVATSGSSILEVDGESEACEAFERACPGEFEAFE